MGVATLLCETSRLLPLNYVMPVEVNSFIVEFGLRYCYGDSVLQLYNVQTKERVPKASIPRNMVALVTKGIVSLAEQAIPLLWYVL